MITTQQIEDADFLCKQARESAVIARDSWAEFNTCYKSFVASYRAAGLPADEALLAFERATTAHKVAHHAAMEHLENSNNIYKQLLAEYKAITS